MVPRDTPATDFRQRYIEATASGMIAAFSKLTASAMRSMLAAGTLTASAMPPSRSKPMRDSPGQRLVSPRRQKSQLPQATSTHTTTRSPAAQPPTPGPHCATTPANSCPGTRGRLTVGMRPSAM